MKKFLSFAMALAMAASLVPATAFASTDLKVSQVVTAEDDDDLYDGKGDTKDAPILTLKATNNFKKDIQEFEVQLENAEWYEKDNKLMVKEEGAKYRPDKGTAAVDDTAMNDAKDAYDDAVAGDTAYKAYLENVEVAEATQEAEDEAKAILDKAQEAYTDEAKALVTAGDPAPSNPTSAQLATDAVLYGDDGTNLTYWETTEGAVIPKGIDLDENKVLAADAVKNDAYYTAYAEAKAYDDAKKAYDDAVVLKEAYEAAQSSYTIAAAKNAEAQDAIATEVKPSEDVATKKAAYEAEKAAYEAAKKAAEEGVSDALDIKITKKSDTTIIVSVTGGYIKEDDEIDIPLYTSLTGGVATVSVDNKDSEFTSETKTFAKTVDGSTKFTTAGVKNFYDGEELKDFFVEEVTAGTLEEGKLTVKVNSGFTFDQKKGKVEMISGDSESRDVTFDVDDDTITVNLTKSNITKNRTGQIRFTEFVLEEDGAKYGNTAELTVRGAGVDRETIEVGTYADFGISMKAEDKELPVVYAGTKADDENDNETLKVVIEETVANSFIDNRKVEITLPEGVEFRAEYDKDGKVVDNGSFYDDLKVSNVEGGKKAIEEALELNKDGDKITIKSMPSATGTDDKTRKSDKKRKIELTFGISAAADFTGDVDVTLSGPGVANEELTATVATVKAPIEVKADVNELKIDYRNTEASDVTIIEPEAGLWEKGDKIILDIEGMQFESGIKAEVVTGDMKLKKLEGDNVEVDKKEGTITLQVDSQSGKTPAEIKITGIKLFMSRNLPAGDYELTVKGDKANDFFMNNYDKDGDDEMANFFNTEDITVMKDYVKVVTAGRDQDDATFTTKITVPVGADKIMAGTKEIALDAPAYINKDGYTMLPVRAVTEALNGVAAIKWDDATKTATINFGQRVFSMTVNSKVMNINGVQTNLLAAPEIKNERIFLPLRDLGYALGLQDDKINWDSATSTATLN